MLVNKYTEPIQPLAADPDPKDQMEITMIPRENRQVRKLAHEVRESRVENRRQFSNIEELLDERDHHLFEELSQLIEKNQHELHAEHRKLRASIEDLLEVLDRHLLTWFKMLQERIQHQSDREGDKLRQSVEARLTQHERKVAALLSSMEKHSSKGDSSELEARFLQHERNMEDALTRLAQSLERAVDEEESEETSYFKLGDRINVYVDGLRVDGTGSFISMNDEVLVWFDSTAQVRFRSLIDSSVSIERAEGVVNATKATL
jgi:hypothetical protein